MRPDIRPGGTFPDYSLPDHTNTVRSLSELQGRDPLILTLARGNYCPKEHQQHLELAANYPKIAVAYTQVATITTDDHHTLQEFRASVGAQWTFMSDPGRTVQQDLDIQEYTDPQHNPMRYPNLYSVGWPDSPHRALRNSTANVWEAAGCPPLAQRPGAGDVIAHFASGEAIVRYEPAPPMAGTTGDIEALSMWAGQSVALARQPQSAADIVAELTSRL